MSADTLKEKFSPDDTSKESEINHTALGDTAVEEGSPLSDDTFIADTTPSQEQGDIMLESGVPALLTELNKCTTLDALFSELKSNSSSIIKTLCNLDSAPADQQDKYSKKITNHIKSLESIVAIMETVLKKEGVQFHILEKFMGELQQEAFSNKNDIFST